MKPSEKTTIGTLRERKRERQRFSVLTGYDYSTARIMQSAGIDSILVGDTYGEVCLGFSTTLPVTVDQLVDVTAAVRRGAPNVFLIGDMPFLSFQTSIEKAIENAGKFMAKAGCDCVKVEVDRRLADTVEALSRATIPVMAHLGLKPQSIHQIGGYRAQGNTAETAKAIIEDARIMQEAGAVAILVEAIPAEVAAIITENSDLPVIGCVSGPHCDGQVVVVHDILGYGVGHPPQSVKKYADLNDSLGVAFREYAADVREGKFPLPERGISMPDKELARLRGMLGHG